jgi:hypothetical protein
MNIQALNDFIYLDISYPSPYFVISYFPIIDNSYTPVNNYMFESKISFETGNPYLQSFGYDVSNRIIFDDELVTDDIIHFLNTISPTTLFTKD